jgi:AcrR family transcriptional regulator
VTALPSSAPGPYLAGRVRRRDEILAAAAALFASAGYTNTSMREVAAASGILAGSLYHHFESKEANAVELIEAYHADLVRAVREFGSVRPRPGCCLPSPQQARVHGRPVQHVPQDAEVDPSLISPSRP